MSSLKDRLEEFKKTFESGLLHTMQRPRESPRCIVRRPSSRHQELKVVHSKSATESQTAIPHGPDRDIEVSYRLSRLKYCSALYTRTIMKLFLAKRTRSTDRT